MKFRIIDQIEVVISNIDDGNMSYNWGAYEEVNRSRINFFETNQVDSSQYFEADLSGDNLLITQVSDNSPSLICTEGIGGKMRQTLAMLTADCFPIVVWSWSYKRFLLLHGSRENLASGIVRMAIEELNQDVEPEEIFIWIGPGIRKESYTLDYIDATQKKVLNGYVLNSKTVIHVDLVGLIKDQCTEMGVLADNIFDCGIDTYQENKLFSHRRSIDMGEPEGRFISCVKMCAEERT